MTYKHIQEFHEARMWIGQVITPVAIITATILANPQNRYEIKNKCDETVNNFKRMFHKDKSCY